MVLTVIVSIMKEVTRVVAKQAILALVIFVMVSENIKFNRGFCYKSKFV